MVTPGNVSKLITVLSCMEGTGNRRPAGHQCRANKISESSIKIQAANPAISAAGTHWPIGSLDPPTRQILWT